MLIHIEFILPFRKAGSHQKDQKNRNDEIGDLFIFFSARVHFHSPSAALMYSKTLLCSKHLFSDVFLLAYNYPLSSGSDLTRRATAEACRQAGISVKDVDVIELHDCFSTNELITYEGLGLCRPGEVSTQRAP